MLIINKIFIVNIIGGIKSDNKLIKKFIKLKIGKLFKSKNLKGKKLSKSQKIAKSKKRLLKNRNLSQFNIQNTQSSFLIFNIKTIFHCL